jgi:hypothetical protein
MAFTSLIDTDLLILYELDDVTLENVHEVNKRQHQLCYSTNLWQIKCGYYDVNNFNMKPNEYKALYYKLKYNQWSLIIEWAEKYNQSLLEWCLYKDQYKRYLIKNIKNLQDIINLTSGKVNKTLLTVTLFKFIHCHQYNFNNNKLHSWPTFKIVVLDKLFDLGVQNAEYKELFDMYHTYLQ